MWCVYELMVDLINVTPFRLQMPPFAQTRDPSLLNFPVKLGSDFSVISSPCMANFSIRKLGCVHLTVTLESRVHTIVTLSKTRVQLWANSPIIADQKKKKIKIYLPRSKENVSILWFQIYYVRMSKWPKKLTWFV